MPTPTEITDWMYELNENELWIAQHELNQIQYVISQYQSDEIQTKTYNTMHEFHKTITPETEKILESVLQKRLAQELEKKLKENPYHPYEHPDSIPF